MPRRPRRHPRPAAARLLAAAATLASVWPVLSNGFVDWDDVQYVVSNRALRGSWLDVLTFFPGYYHPLTVLTYKLEFSLFGLQPLPYHLTNLLLHAACCVAVYRFLSALGARPPSAFLAALLFAVHPVHAEPAAWISGRKELLWGLFAFWSLTCYLRFPDGRCGRFLRWSLFFFLLAALAKPAALVLPLALPLLDYYRGRRFSPGLLAEKAPYLLLALPLLALSGSPEGFLLGGGIGFNMRKWGVGSDLLRATDLVTADGSLVNASADRDSSLFWACRGGGGGNFGVNTAFTLQTQPVSTVTVFNITWTKDLPRVLRLLLTELASAPDDFGSKISVTIPSLSERCDKVGTTLSILGQLHPSKTTLKEIFKSTWELADTRNVKEDVAYWAGQDFLTETTYPYFYQEKSSYMKAADIGEEAIAAMFDWAAKMPGTSMPSAFKFFQVGGAINRMGPTETAYVHRGFDWLFSVEANWWRPTDPLPLVEANLDWQQRFYEDVNRRTKAVGAFQNFPDPSLADWRSAYYGENLARLSQVKQAVDPSMLFTYPQAIRPA